jgi:hypothetical protein
MWSEDVVGTLDQQTSEIDARSNSPTHAASTFAQQVVARKRWLTDTDFDSVRRAGLHPRYIGRYFFEFCLTASSFSLRCVEGVESLPHSGHCTHHAPVFRLSFRAVIREANVVGFMASNSAAPPRPKILPPVCFSASAMVSRSWRFISLRVSKAGGEAV